MKFKILERSIQHRCKALERNTIINVASRESLQMLAENARPVRLRKGAMLWQEGEPAQCVACVVHGCLLVQKTDHHGSVVYYHPRKNGDLLGHAVLSTSLRAGGPLPLRRAATLAREQSVVMTIDSALFRVVVDREPPLMRRMLWELSRSLHAFMDEYFVARVHGAKFLLAAKLLTLAATEGPHGGRVYLPYSQADLSSFTGLGARNINKFLSELPGVHTVSGRKGVQISSIAALEAFVRAGPAAD